MNEFTVEGRYFPDSLQAYTFATIQADRMKRPVEVRTMRGEWHATAYPPQHQRPHLVRQPQGVVSTSWGA